MVVQINYNGAAGDFSWIVPMQNVPVEGSFDTFPQFAMQALDANTSPRIFLETNCENARFEADSGPLPSATGSDPNVKDNVTVHQQEQVGPFDVVVVESDSADDLVMWLRANGYRVTNPMLPYIENYVASQMKFLALKLQPTAKVSQIAPFQMTLPGTSPGVPLKMTALAAEPLSLIHI